jgi:hypothetical protein
MARRPGGQPGNKNAVGSHKGHGGHKGGHHGHRKGGVKK